MMSIYSAIGIVLSILTVRRYSPGCEELGPNTLQPATVDLGYVSINFYARCII